MKVESTQGNREFMDRVPSTEEVRHALAVAVQEADFLRRLLRMLERRDGHAKSIQKGPE